MPTFTQVASDTITGADQDPIVDGSLGTGVWSTVSGMVAMRRLSNTAAPHSFGSDCGSVYSGTSFTAGQYSRANLTTIGTSGSGAGIALTVLNSAISNTWYRFAIDHNGSFNAEVSRSVNGSFTFLDHWLQTFVDGDQFTFAVSGEVLSVYDKTLTLVRTISDIGGGVPTTGKPGIGYSSSESSGTFLDDWSGGNFATGHPLTISSGSLTIAGQSVTLRPGSTTYLRYRK